MARNKIGIEVQVEFPTIKELQADLDKKWGSINNKFEAKINVGVDKTSLESVKAEIRKAIKEEVFELKLNSGNAFQAVSRVGNELKKLDEELAKPRELKIDIKGIDMDKPFRGILQDIQQIDRAMESQTGAIRQQTQELDKQAGTFAKIQQIQKELKDGTIATTVKVTRKDDNGGQTTVTQNPNGRVDVDTTHNKEKALKEIESIMKDIHKLSLDQVDATVAEFNHLEREKRIQQDILRHLMDEFQIRYNINANDEKRIQTLQRTQELERNINREAKEQSDLEREQRKLEQDREKSLRDIESKMKEIHRLSMKQMDTSINEYQLLEHEKRIQQDILGDMLAQYRLQNQMNAKDDDRIQNLQRVQQMENRIREEAIRQREAKNQQQDAEREIADAVSRVAQLERQKHSIALKLITAKKEEEEYLQEQFAHYQQIQVALQRSYNLQQKMTAEQQQELNNLRTINNLEVDRAIAKQKAKEQTEKEAEAEKKQAQAQKESLAQMKADLKEVHTLRMKIAEIEARGSNRDGDMSQLNILRQELEIAQDRQIENRRIAEQQGHMTDEVYRTLTAMTQVNQQERERVARSAEHIQSQQQTNQLIDNYVDALQDVNRLQRDLVFSGMRESEVIERQLQARQQNLSELRQSLAQNQLITAEQREQLRLLEQQSKQSLTENRMRQDARERDQAFDDTGGIIDPMTTYSHYEQGFREVVENMRIIDEAYMRVVKVADASDEAKEKFKENSYDIASSLGVGADEYMLAVEKWVTAGETLASSQELAKTSLIGSFVGNIDPDLMVKWMSVPLNAFEKEGLEANDVINVMNETSNNHAVEMEELGKAYMRSAGTVKNAGLSFEELTGLITGAQEATRMGGERIGTALKTIGINYNNIKGKITEGESKKFDMLKGFGIDLSETDGLMEALEKIVAVRDKLSETDMNEILYRLAGKEHSSILGGIIDQWDVVGKAIMGADEQMGKGEDGSAYKEFEEQKESVRFQLAELNNAWMELMNTVGESDGTISKILEGLTNGLNKVSDILQNDKAMEALKFVAIAVAMHAVTNGAFRMWDALSTGSKGAYKNLTDLVPAIDKLVSKLRGARRASDELNASTRAQNAGSRAGDLADSAGDLVDGDGRNRNDNNNNDDNTRSGRRRRRETTENAGDLAGNISDITQAGDRAESTMGKIIGKTGKFLALVPILGDALLLLDLMGVPVFENLGKGFDSIIETQDEAIQKQKEMNEEFAKKNDLLNGKIEDSQDEVGGLREDFESKDTNKKKEGVQGYMTPEEFTAFQEQFNAQVDKFDLDKEFKINMNDTTHIQQQLDKLDAKLKELKMQEAIDLTEKIGGDLSGVQKAQEQIAGLKGEQEKLADASKKAKGEMDKLKESDGTIKPENMEMYNYWAMQLQLIENRQGHVNATLKNQEEALKNSQSAVEQKASALLALGEAFDASKIKAEDQVPTLTAMYSEYNKLKKSLDDANIAQGVLSKNSKLSNDQFQEILKLVPEAGKKYGKYSVDHINADKNIRKELNELVKKEQEHASKAEQSGGKAVKAMEGVVGKTKDGAKAMEDAKKKAEGLGKGIDEIPVNKKAKVDVEITGIKWLDKVINFFSKSWSTTATVSAGGNAKTTHVSAGSPNPFVSTSKSISASVGTGLPVLGTGTSLVSNATSSNYNKDRENLPPARINEDVWRYWGTEMYGLGNIQISMNELNRQLKDANENYVKMIYLYKQQQQMMKSQISEQKNLRSAKNREIDEVLKKLSGYGFKVNMNSDTIHNLDISKGFSGKKAEEAQVLLDRWKALYTEINGIDETIANINQQINDINDQIKQAEIKKEFKAWEAYLKKIDALLTSVNNKDDINSRKLGFISGEDKELELVETEKAMNDAKNSMSSLIKEFNTLSQSSIAYEENGTALKGTLDKLKSEILAQADTIIKYQQAINEIEFSRVVKDLDEFNKAIDENQSRIGNNIENLKEGLLSGTDFDDLVSATSVGLDLSRDNQYEKIAQERIELEKEVQLAMDGFAKKNIDRQTGVSNATLAIEVNKYNQMLKMAKQYSNGQTASYKEIKSTFDNLIDIGKMDESYTFVDKLDDAFDTLKVKQDALTKKYNEGMLKALSPQAQEKLTNQFIIDNMKLQEEYYRTSIESNKKAIAEFESQLKDSTLTDEQEEKIKQQITSLEKENIDSQNKIKDTIKERFEFEFSLLEEAITEYDKFAKELDYSMNLLKALGGDNFEAKDVIMEGSLSVEKARNAEITKSLSSLQRQLAMYEEGSYEWKLINQEVEEYKKLLQDSNLELIEMNKNIMSNSFDNTMNKVEREMFNGKTIEQFKDYHDLWITGLEREIALEDMYQRLADLGTTTYNEKMALLAKQEKLSRFEMDYLNKQLDVLEIQKKLENINKERTVQTLRQQADGTWDWEYTADADEVSKVQEELADAQLQLQEAEQKAREEYADKLEGILDNAENGQYETVEDFQNAIDELTEAYTSIVGDFPQIKEEYLKELIDAYSKYVTGNVDILNGVTTNASVNPQVFEGFSNEIAKAFKDISKDLGESFATALIEKLPNFGKKTEKQIENQLVTITLEKVEFPNATDSKSIQDAILSLPKIALQKSKEKL